VTFGRTFVTSPNILSRTVFDFICDISNLRSEDEGDTMRRIEQGDEVSTVADDQSKTVARKNFETNLDEILAFTRRTRVSHSDLPKAIEVLRRTVEKGKRTLEKEEALDGTPV
jgi:hypothetical protein